MMMLIIIIIFIIIIIIITISEQGVVHFPSNGVGYAEHYLHAFPSEAGTRYVYDRFDTGPCGTLHTSIAPQPPTVKDWILARVMSQGCSRLDEFDLRVLLQWGIGNWTQAVHTLPGTLGERYLDVMTGNIFLNFPWPHIIWRQWHCYSPHSSTVCHSGSRKWTPHQTRHQRESLVYRWWAEPRRYTWSSFCRSPLRQTTQGNLFHYVSKANNENPELGLLHDDAEPITFHAILACLELGDTLILRVRDEHQVINIKKFPWYTSADLTR